MKKLFVIGYLFIVSGVPAFAQGGFDALGIAPTPPPSATPVPAVVLTPEQKEAALAPGVQANRVAEAMRPVYAGLVEQYKALYTFFHNANDGLTFEEKMGALNDDERVQVGTIAWQIYNLIVTIDPKAPVQPPTSAAPPQTSRR